MDSTTFLSKKEVVKNYLMHLINRAGNKPNRLPGEMELCEKFSVSRFTVRAAIADFEKSEAILHIPGRKGPFSNPVYSRTMPNLVAIVMRSGRKGYFHSCDLPVLSSLMHQLESEGTDIEIPLLNARIPMEAVQEIENYSYDAVVWFSDNSEEEIHAFNYLLEKAFPLLVIDSLFVSDVQRAKSNSISMDFAEVGVLRADCLMQNSVCKVVYTGMSNTTFRSLCDILKKNGITLYEDKVIEDITEIKKKLPDILAEHEVDAIVSDGDVLRYQAVIDVLNSSDKWSRVKLFIGDDYIGKTFRRKNRRNQIILMRDRADMFHRIGKQTACQIKKMLKTNQRFFKNIEMKSVKR